MKFLTAVFSFFLFTVLSAQSVSRDTVFEFSNTPPSDKVIFKSPKGKLYKVDFVTDDDDKFEPRIPVSLNCSDSAFAGTARKFAKTTPVVTTKTEDFATVSALLKTLQPDAFMRKKLTSGSKRIAEENRNVRLMKDTYIFAFKKESDIDYHVIIGDNVDPKKATFMNVEISGLPSTGFKQLQAVRKVFEKQFVQVCNSAYAVFATNPVKVAIEGSVFFDVDHQAGQIGPVGFQPALVWEIHPVTKITFLK